MSGVVAGFVAGGDDEVVGDAGVLRAERALIGDNAGGDLDVPASRRRGAKNTVRIQVRLGVLVPAQQHLAVAIARGE